MKIEKVAIKNFRQHREIELDFTSPQADFVIIKGQNGAGKTNFLNAITWALYGDLEESSSGNNAFLNDAIVDAMSEGDYSSCEVRLELNLQNGRMAYIHRKQECVKTKPKVAAPYGNSEVTVQVYSESNKVFEVEPNAQLWIDRNLPQRFKPYFLFDGEKLERFFKESDSLRIRSAIQEVAQIDVLERMHNNLEKVAHDLSQRAGREAGGDGKALSDRLEELDEQISSESQANKQLLSDLTEASDLEVELDAMLINFGAFEANIRRKRELDTLLEIKRAELDRNKIELEARLRAVAPTVFTFPALISFQKAVQEAKDNNTLPPPVDLSYLKELLLKQKCICGSDLTPGQPGHEHITQAIKDYDTVSEVGAVLFEYSLSNQSTIDKLSPTYQLVNDKNEQIANNIQEIGDAEEELRVLASQLEGVDDAEQLSLATKRNAARSKVEQTKSKLKTNEGNLERLRREAVEISKAIDKLELTNSAAAKARALAQFAGEVSSVATELFKGMNDQVRLAVADSLDSQFKSMIWKQDAFDRVTIDENFKVSVRNRHGFEELNRLAAGERLCLAFAFALTLSKTAGLSFPLVVDTPMGRLGQDVQVNLAKVLCDSTKGEGSMPNHQLIILMTSSEYNNSVAEVMDKRKPLTLEIKFNEAELKSEIK